MFIDADTILKAFDEPQWRVSEAFCPKLSLKMEDRILNEAVVIDGESYTAMIVK